jgi:hypothetical protein
MEEKKYCICQKPYNFDDETKNDIMIECGTGDMCQNSIKWFHIGCVRVQKKNLVKLMWFCPKCVKAINREDAQPGRMSVVKPPFPLEISL